jgi:F0F1-type ATP synthase membrane subunit b/b'
LLGAAVVACFVTVFFQHTALVNLRLEMRTMEREMGAIRTNITAADAQLAQTLAAIRADIDSTRKESASTVEQARADARRQAERAASKAASQVSTKLSESQEEQKRQLTDQLDQIRSSSELAKAKLTDITTEVGTVKTDVAATRSDLEKTIADLHRTTGDLGIMSGLIATNSRELAALRELGERDYYEFTVSKAKAPVRVADIQLLLKKSDPKKNRFTVEIAADDKTVEKKDRNVNEPVQFYVTSKARQPLELVVNEVRKDAVVGYIAVPKARQLTGKRL